MYKELKKWYDLHKNLGFIIKKQKVKIPLENRDIISSNINYIAGYKTNKNFNIISIFKITFYKNIKQKASAYYILKTKNKLINLCECTKYYHIDNKSTEVNEEKYLKDLIECLSYKTQTKEIKIFLNKLKMMNINKDFI